MGSQNLKKAVSASVGLRGFRLNRAVDVPAVLSGSFRKWGGTLFWGPYNKDPTI